MGTRGLWGFVDQGVEKLTYNHFDSYPSALGASLMGWARSLNEDTMVEAREKARALQLVDGSATNAQGQEWYHALRENQDRPAETLECGFMVDSATFAFDSLFCEWAYVIDFDAATFEVYRGFQEQPPTDGRWATPERLAEEQAIHDASHRAGSDLTRYYAIQRVGHYPLLSLPEDYAHALDELERAVYAARENEEV